MVFDLDGTLLTSDKTVHRETVLSVLACVKFGFVIVIATSRPIRAVESFVEKDLLEQSVIITLNGAVTYAHGLDSRPTLNGTLGERLRNMDYNLSIETDGRRFGSNHRQTSDTLCSQQATPADDVNWHDIDFDRVSKIAADGEGRFIDVEGYAEVYDLNVVPEMSGTFVNFLPKGSDKGAALVAYASQNEVDLSRSIAFGDDLPDIRLFDEVGTGVAMDGSPAALASVAHHVIGNCDGPSIGNFLQTEVLIESWRRHYNAVRPHDSLGYQPPAPETIVAPNWPPGYATLRRPSSLAEKPSMH